jgi:hypothetical protein
MKEIGRHSDACAVVDRLVRVTKLSSAVAEENLVCRFPHPLKSHRGKRSSEISF